MDENTPQPPPPPGSPIPPDHQLPPPDHDRRRRRRSRQWIWILLLVAVAIIILLALHRHNDNSQAAAAGKRAAFGPTTINAVAATQGDIGVYFDAIGTVTPVYTASISSQVNGTITAVHYREGQTVEKGAPLIDIDPRPYQATLQQAQGQLQHDEGLLAQAQMDLDRYKAAWARNGIAKQTLDDQEKVVEQDIGTVKNDQGAVAYDEVQLGYCHITAPFTGRVGLRLVDPGNVVSANGGTTLAVITQIDPITVIFTIAEDSVPAVQTQLAKGNTLPVDVYDRSDQHHIATGRLLTIDNQIDTTTGTVKLRALFDNKTMALFPNQFVNSKLLVNTLHDQTLLPSETIQHNGTQPFVYVIQNKKAKVVNVQTGVTNKGMTAVTGISPGTQVADSSFEKLQDGQPVVISQKPQPTEQSTTP
jgi:membrane fusion protein, multidrug efflux system